MVICGEQMEVEDCPACGGEGYFDCYEEDPINFFPGEMWDKCTECNGKGFLIVCPNTPHKEEEGGDQKCR